MKGVQLTKLAQELNLTNLTPDIDLTEIYVKTAEINRPALQLTGYLEHFANERVQIIGYVEYTYLMQLSIIVMGIQLSLYTLKMARLTM